MTTEVLHVPVDKKTKEQAAAVLKPLGLSVSDAVRFLLDRIAEHQGFPLPLAIPNEQTRAAMQEARSMPASRFVTADALFAALEKGL